LQPFPQGDFETESPEQIPIATGVSATSTNATLEAVGRLDMPALWFGPNVDAGADVTARAIRGYRRRHALRNVRFFDNLPPEDFIRVLDKAACIVGNSSVAIREASWMGVPAVNVGRLAGVTVIGEDGGLIVILMSTVPRSSSSSQIWSLPPPPGVVPLCA